MAEHVVPPGVAQSGRPQAAPSRKARRLREKAIDLRLTAYYGWNGEGGTPRQMLAAERKANALEIDADALERAHAGVAAQVSQPIREDK